MIQDGGVSSGYDAALYSAATTYYQQQQAAKTGTTWQYKKGQQQKPKQKQPPKQPQLHYCEVCKISCAGPQVRNTLPVSWLVCDQRVMSWSVYLS